MLAGTAFAVVLIDDKCPGLIARLEALSNTRNGVCFALCWSMFVIECNVDLTAFIIHGGDDW